MALLVIRQVQSSANKLFRLEALLLVFNPELVAEICYEGVEGYEII